MSEDPIVDLLDLADALAVTRETHGFHPKVDGKLAEAEVNLRGVAGVLEARDDE